MKPNKTYNLLVSDPVSDPSAVAVITDVYLSDTKTLRDKLTLVLAEHYDADAVIGQIPENIKGSTYPIFSVPYKVEMDGVKWDGEIEISCIAIY